MVLRITSVGDCCVDIYPKEMKYYLGGTAFNRAAWLAQNGAKVSLVSAVGNDDWGQKYLSACRRLNINTDYLSVLPGQTSQVEITLNQQKQSLFSDWRLGVLKNFKPRALPGNQDTFIVTGLEPIKQLLQLPFKAFKVVDFDGETPYTLHSTEIKKYAPRFDLVTSSAGRKINHPMVLLTLGADGSKLFYNQKEYHCPAPKIISQDTTGAGDIYIAAFVLNYLKSKNISLSMKLATEAAINAITSPRNLSV